MTFCSYASPWHVASIDTINVPIMNISTCRLQYFSDDTMHEYCLCHAKFLVGCDHVINECCTASMISLSEFHFLSVNVFFTNT